MRLGAGFSFAEPFPDKPPGMHWRTYLRMRVAAGESIAIYDQPSHLSSRGGFRFQARPASHGRPLNAGRRAGCAHADPLAVTTVLAAAPAARCKKLRRRTFMTMVLQTRRCAGQAHP
jgi:hypothetical protein